MTPLLQIDLDLPTNSHSSLQRLIHLKIRLFATDFHITSLLRDTLVSVIYSVCCIVLIQPLQSVDTQTNCIVLYVCK